MIKGGGGICGYEILDIGLAASILMGTGAGAGAGGCPDAEPLNIVKFFDGYRSDLARRRRRRCVV